MDRSRRRQIPGVQAILAAFAVIALAGRTAVAQRIIFVDADAVGRNDGMSWADARISLQDALANARSGDAIWVARGVYKPGSTRAATFQLRDGVTILGGFAGTEDPAAFDPALRDFDANITILDGDIGSPAATDNVFHVVTASGVGATAVLDGFTITGGFADGITQNRQDVGAGMLNLDASPTIRHCTFRGNQAGTRGGAAHIDGGSPLFLHCRFVGNRTTVTQAANNLGGAVYAGAQPGRSATARFVNGLFVGNRAGVGNGGFGGAIYDDLQSRSTLVNCTLLHNFADTHGGGVFGGPVMTNCIVWGNRDRDGTTRASQVRGSAVATFSAVQGGWPGLGNVADDPLLRDPLGPDGLAGTDDDDARLSPGSPCIDAGDNTALPPGVTVDLDRAPRFVDDLVTPDVGRPPGAAIVDMGAFEYQALCGSAADCDNGFHCDGAEPCVGGRCRPGVVPDCDDGAACTRDSCRESDHACVHEPDDARCDNGVFCDGRESCDALTGCKPGVAINCDDHVACTIDTCDEGSRVCVHLPDDAACDDGVFCNGVERCDAALGCRPGEAIVCDDGVTCTVDRCDESIRRCVFEPNDARCDDGRFCNGVESCGPAGCVAGDPPCAEPALCDEIADLCLSHPPQCAVDADCDDDNPCTDDACADGVCERTFNDADCDDGDDCTASDACLLGVCAGTPILNCGVLPQPPPNPAPPSPPPSPLPEPPIGPALPESPTSEELPPRPSVTPHTPPVVVADADTDTDGVPDADDLCDDTPPGLTVDATGCPIDPPPGDPAPIDESVDSDEDGIPDQDDRCPATPHGIAVGDEGCPIADEPIGSGQWRWPSSEGSCGPCGAVGTLGIVIWTVLIGEFIGLRRGFALPMRRRRTRGN